MVKVYTPPMYRQDVLDLVPGCVARQSADGSWQIYSPGKAILGAGSPGDPEAYAWRMAYYRLTRTRY